MADASSDIPGPVAALRGAAGLVAHDPVGILLPCMGLLALDGVVLLEVRQAVLTVGPLWAVAGGGMAWLIAAIGSAPLRQAVLRRGARAAGRRVPARRTLALMGCQLLLAGIDVLGIAATGAALGFVGWALLAYGWWSLATLAAAVVLLASSILALAVRVLLAWAPLEVVFGGRSGAGALLASARRGQPVHAGVAVVGGALATGLGALLCLAGTLPGYPLRDLALLLAYPEDPT